MRRRSISSSQNYFLISQRTASTTRCASFASVTLVRCLRPTLAFSNDMPLRGQMLNDMFQCDIFIPRSPCKRSLEGPQGDGEGAGPAAGQHVPGPGRHFGGPRGARPDGRRRRGRKGARAHRALPVDDPSTIRRHEQNCSASHTSARCLSPSLARPSCALLIQ